MYPSDNVPIGGLPVLMECLQKGIIPFLIADELKAFNYRGLQNWETEPGYLRDTCGLAQDRIKQVLEYFNLF